MLPAEGIPTENWLGIKELENYESEVFDYTSVDEYTPLLIKGLNLKKRIVKRAKPKNKDELLFPTLTEHPVEVILGEKEYKIELVGLKNNEPTPELKVVLSHNNLSQTIWSPKEHGKYFAWVDPNFTVKWAGDLDGDEELDLIIDLYPKYSSGYTSLFLSSFATNKELVQKVGDASGCGC